MGTHEPNHLFTKLFRRNRSEWLSDLSQGPGRLLVLLALIALLTTASAMVIVHSNMKLINNDDLFAPPATVSALNSAANLLMQMVLPGIIILIWWRSARNGTTIAHLQYICTWKDIHDWKRKLSRRDGEEVVLVILATLMVAAMGPSTGYLFQKSISVISFNLLTSKHINFALASRIPDNWIGDAGTNDFESKFTFQLRQWYLVTPITSYQCDGNCTAVVPGAGLVSNCSTIQSALDLLDVRNAGSQVFSINTTRIQDATGAPILRVTASFVSATDHLCVGTVVTETCDVRPSLSDYTLIFSNQSVTMDSSKPVGQPFSYNDDVANHTSGPLDGLKYLGDQYWKTAVIHSFLSSTTQLQPSLTNDSLLASAFSTENNGAAYNGSTVIGNRTVVANCGTIYSNPSQAILHSFDDIMFRCSYASFNASTNASDASKAINAQQILSAAVYKANHVFLAGAVSLVLATLFLLCFLLWKYHDDETGGTTPLDMALIFSSPLLNNSDTHTDVKTVMAALGDQKVKICDGRLQIANRYEEMQHAGLESQMNPSEVEKGEAGISVRVESVPLT
jgi:hypothetical protein